MSQIRIHHIIEHSTVNGPGTRFVVWVQGCPLNCDGCFNQLTHSKTGGFDMDIAKLAEQINKTQNIRGITFSGGEPLFQADAVYELLQLIRKGLDVFVFSGYTIEEVWQDERKKQVIPLIDAGVFGRYNKNLPHPFYGKKLILNGQRIKKDEVKPWLNTEIIIQNDLVQVSGLYKEQVERKMI